MQKKAGETRVKLRKVNAENAKLKGEMEIEGISLDEETTSEIEEFAIAAGRLRKQDEQDVEKEEIEGLSPDENTTDEDIADDEQGSTIGKERLTEQNDA
jgi:hypothetical protein